MESKKQLSINLIANVAAYSVNIIISFFMTPYLIRVLGKEAYSFYPIANNFVQYMGIITVALNSMASRFITIELAKGNDYKANVYFSSVFYANIILSAVLLIVMTGVVIFLDQLLDIPLELVVSVRILFILIFVSMLVNIITSVFGIATFAKNRIDLRSLGDVIHSILKLVLYIGLFYVVVPDIIYVGVISVVLALVTFLINALYTKKLLPGVCIKKSLFEFNAVKEILFSGVWNSVNQIGSILMFSLSIVYCNVLIGVEAGGEYAIIQTIPNFINGIISTMAAVFIPSLTRTYATKTTTELVREVKTSQKIMGMITNIPIVVFMVIGIDFYQLWVPGENALRLHVLTLLTIFHLLFIGVTWTIVNLNTVLNKVKVPALYLLGSGIINFFLVMLLVKHTSLGIYAVPLSSAIILFVWAAFFIPIYPCRVMKVPWNTFYGTICKMLLSSAILLGVTFALRQLLPQCISWFALIGFCAMMGCLGIIINMFVVMNKADRNRMLRFLKRKKLFSR